MRFISTIILIFGLCATLSNEKSIGSKSAIINILRLLIKEIGRTEKFNAIQYEKPDKYKNYAFTWKIDGISEILRKKNFSMVSEEFSVPGYPFKAKAKFTIDDDLFTNALVFIDENKKGAKIPLQVIPEVTFTLRASNGTNYDVVRSAEYLFGSAFRFFGSPFGWDKYYYGRWLARQSWLANSSYVRNDSIEIDIAIDPPSVAKAIASNDGTLAVAIDHYIFKKQREIRKLEWHHSSPYFYTSPDGYRVKVQMRLFGYNDYSGVGLSAQIVFLSGENDSSLSRSFAHRTTIIVFNQLDSTRHFKKTVENDIEDERDYVIDLLHHDEIESGGFLNGDTLHYKIVMEVL